MKVSLIFVLVALYGVVADDSASSEEASTDASVTVDASTSSNNNLGSMVQTGIDKVAALAHNSVVNISSTVNSGMGVAMGIGSKINGLTSQYHQDAVQKITNVAQNFTNSGIKQVEQWQEKLKNTTAGNWLNPALNAKKEMLNGINQVINVAGQMEAAKGAMITKGVDSILGAIKDVTGIATNATAAGASTGKAVTNQVSGMIGGLLNGFGGGFGRLSTSRFGLRASS